MFFRQVLLFLVILFLLVSIAEGKKRKKKRIGCRHSTNSYVTTGTYAPGSLCWDIHSFKGLYASDGNLIVRDGLGLAIFDTSLNAGAGHSLEILSNGNVQIVDINGNVLWQTGTGSYGKQVGFSFDLREGLIVMLGCDRTNPSCRHTTSPFLGTYWGYTVIWKSSST